MQLANTVSLQHWILLGIFFLIFAFCGLKQKHSKNGCTPCHYIALGIVSLVINSLLLVVANRVGYDQFNLLHLITLRQTTIESSFIILGYGLIIQGSALFIKNLVLPGRTGRSFG